MFILLQKILPKQVLSRLLGYLANWQWVPFKNGTIRLFIRYFKVDMADYLGQDAADFKSFNNFFIRSLQPEARPIPTNAHAMMSSVDGCVSQLGQIQKTQLIQAKGMSYELSDLLAGDAALTANFMNGDFMTTYLAPKDYHRVHMPTDGRLVKMIYVPGRLFSVNPIAAQGISCLFARNERVICVFETAHGLMAVILVGAMLVGSMVTAWEGVVAPGASRKICTKTYDQGNIFLKRGDELGYFQWGSTVIVLSAAGRIQYLNELRSGDSVRMGQVIGQLI